MPDIIACRLPRTVVTRVYGRKTQEGLYRVVFEEDLRTSPSPSFHDEEYGPNFSSGRVARRNRDNLEPPVVVVTSAPKSPRSPSMAIGTRAHSHRGGAVVAPASNSSMESATTSSETGKSAMAETGAGARATPSRSGLTGSGAGRTSRWDRVNKADRRRPVEYTGPLPRATVAGSPPPTFGPNRQNASPDSLRYKNKGSAMLHPADSSSSISSKGRRPDGDSDQGDDSGRDSHSPVGSGLREKSPSRSADASNRCPELARSACVSRSRWSRSPRSGRNAGDSDSDEARRSDAVAWVEKRMADRKAAAVQQNGGGGGDGGRGTSATRFSRYDANGGRQSGRTESVLSRASLGGTSGAESTASKRQRTSRSVMISTMKYISCVFWSRA